MYDPLYNENIGLGGFRCRDCKRVTRTELGMRAHMWRVHGQKVQSSFNFPAAQPVRDSGRQPEQRDDRASDNRPDGYYDNDGIFIPYDASLDKD